MKTLPIPSRRLALQQLATLSVAAPSLLHTSATLASPDLYRIPGDFERARAIWIGYDEGHQAFTLALVEALLPYVPLKLLAASAEQEQELRGLLRKRGIRADSLEFFNDEQAIFFLRDSAVFVSGMDGSLGVIDFKWSEYGLPGWCAQRYAKDAKQIAECSADAQGERGDLDLSLARLAKARVFSSQLFLEGGGVEVNGRGLMLANRALLTQRNPGMSLAAIEKALLALPGMRQIIWLPAGLAQDPLLRSTIVGRYVGWGTGGHTDEFVRFADANTVLLAWPDDSTSARHPVDRLNQRRMQACFEVLSRAIDADGHALRIVKIPMPTLIERRIVLNAQADTNWSEQWNADSFAPAERRRNGDVVVQVAAASYLNFVIANGVVLVPDYLAHGTPASTQVRVKQLYKAAFPGRKIRFIDAIGLNWYGGGPHCATLVEPMGA
jgi:agmatine deiminase